MLHDCPFSTDRRISGTTHKPLRWQSDDDQAYQTVNWPGSPPGQQANFTKCKRRLTAPSPMESFSFWTSGYTRCARLSTLRLVSRYILSVSLCLCLFLASAASIFPSTCSGSLGSLWVLPARQSNFPMACCVPPRDCHFSISILPVLPAWHSSLSVTNEAPIFKDETAKEFFSLLCR